VRRSGPVLGSRHAGEGGVGGERMSLSEDAGGHRATDLVLEGLPPHSDRPSWLALVLVVLVALLLGLGVGYGVGAGSAVTPEPTLAVVSSQPSASSSTTPLGHPFIGDPCRLVPISSLFTGDLVTSRRDPSALPGMTDCTYLDPSGRILAALSLRQPPTTAKELAVIVGEMFQREGVSDASVDGQHAYFTCARAWTPCRPALALVREPYFLVVSVQPGGDELKRVSALAAAILRSLPS
jgi:hypothetical protein